MNPSTKILDMQMLVGVILVIFGLTFGTIVLFGFMDTFSGANDINNGKYGMLVLFKTIYFVMVATIFGIIYHSKRHLLKAKTEHIIMIVSVLIFSASVAGAAGNLKSLYDTNQYLKEDVDIEQLQAENAYYSQYAQSLMDNIESIRSENVDLEAELANLTEKISNRTPVIVETIITLPPETIYVEESAPTVGAYYEDEYEDEHEEEDD